MTNMVGNCTMQTVEADSIFININTFMASLFLLSLLLCTIIILASKFGPIHTQVKHPLNPVCFGLWQLFDTVTWKALNESTCIRVNRNCRADFYSGGFALLLNKLCLDPLTGVQNNRKEETFFLTSSQSGRLYWSDRKPRTATKTKRNYKETHTSMKCRTWHDTKT